MNTFYLVLTGGTLVPIDEYWVKQTIIRAMQYHAISDDYVTFFANTFHASPFELSPFRSATDDAEECFMTPTFNVVAPSGWFAQTFAQESWWEAVRIA